MSSLDPLQSANPVEMMLDRSPPVVSPDTPLDNLWSILGASDSNRPAAHQIRYACVVDGDRCLGLITAADTVAVLSRGDSPHNTRAADVLHHPQAILRLEELSDTAYLREKVQQSDLFLVLTAEDRLVGVLTSRCALEFLSRELNEWSLLGRQYRTSEGQIRRIIEAMADIILVVDIWGNIVHVAPTSAARQAENEDLIAATIAQFQRPEAGPAFLEPVRRSLESQERQTFEYQLKLNNREVWFAAQISPTVEADAAIWVARNITEAKQIERALADLSEQLEQRVAERTAQLELTNQSLLEEIVERRQIEAALHRSEERFEIALKNSPITVFTKNAELRYTWIYNPFPSIDPQNIIGQANADIFSADDARRLSEIERRVLQTATGVREETFLVLNGSLHYYDLTVEPLRDWVGHVTGIVCAAMDVTDRRLTEEALKTLNQELESIVEERTSQLQAINAQLLASLSSEQELNELKSRFVTMTSHEFRTPLTTILGSAELLKHYGSKWSEEKKQLYLDRIHKTVGHMTRLLDDVLTVSQAENGQIIFSPAEVDLVDLCHTLIEGCTASDPSSHVVRFVHEGNCQAVCLDTKLVRQILSNLLSNAIKYSLPNTEIDLEVNCNSDRVTFVLRDRGIGIPEEDLKHLFESFHRSKNVGNIQGTGLGLSIVKKAVDLHRGDIQVVSEEGLGSTFTVILPLES